MGGERARFNPSPFKIKPSAFLAGGFESAPGRFGPAAAPVATSAVAGAGVGGPGGGFGQGMQGLSSLEEKEEEEGGGSPMTEASSPVGDGLASGEFTAAAGGGRPASFERLRRA